MLDHLAGISKTTKASYVSAIRPTNWTTMLGRLAGCLTMPSNKRWPIFGTFSRACNIMCHLTHVAQQYWNLTFGRGSETGARNNTLEAWGILSEFISLLFESGCVLEHFPLNRYFNGENVARCAMTGESYGVKLLYDLHMPITALFSNRRDGQKALNTPYDEY